MHFKRITHHAIWFTLLGPFVGVPAAIMTLAFAESNKSQFLFEVAQVLMLLMFVGWLVGWRDTCVVNRYCSRLLTWRYLRLSLAANFM